MKNNQKIVIAVGGITIAIIAFIAGIQFQKRQQPQLGFRGNGQFQQGMMRNGQQNMQQKQTFRPLSGEITKFADNMLTIKTDDQSSKIVIVSDSTSINQASEAARTDLTVGKKVMVMGQENTDGSVTAQTIQLNPLNQMLNLKVTK